MGDSVLALPNWYIWILGILIGLIFSIIGVIYTNMQKKIDMVSKELNTYKICTDRRLEELLIGQAKLSEKIISKDELMNAVDEAVTKQFLKWENLLLNEGRLKPTKRGE